MVVLIPSLECLRESAPASRNKGLAQPCVVAIKPCCGHSDWWICTRSQICGDGEKKEDHMENSKDFPRGSAVNKELSPALNAQTALSDEGRSVTPTVVAWAFERTKDMLGLTGANSRHSIFVINSLRMDMTWRKRQTCEIPIKSWRLVVDWTMTHFEPR